MSLDFPLQAYFLFIPCALLSLAYCACLVLERDRAIRDRMRRIHPQLRDLILVGFLFFLSSSAFLIFDTKVHLLPDPVFVYVMFIVFSTYLFGQTIGIWMYVISIAIVEYYLYVPSYEWNMSDSTIYSMFGGVVAIMIGEYLRNNAIRLRHMNVELQELVAVKERVADMIAHDIGNSLMVLKTQTELLQTKSASPYDDARLIGSEVDRLSALVESVLLIAKTSHEQRLQREIFDIQSHYAAEMNRYRSIYPSHQFAYEHDDDRMVHADKQVLARIVNNLIDNAVKYSPAGTLVRLKTVRREHALEIIVSDEGVGMTKEQIEEFMQPYRQGSRSSKGVGLGMYIVHSLTDLYGGTIAVDSAPEKGTTFHIMLPQ